MIEKYKHLKIRVLKETYQYVLLKQDSSLSDLNLLFLNSKNPVALFISDEEKSFIAPTDLNPHVDIDLNSIANFEKKNFFFNFKHF
jgi:hypothetical protein